MLYGVLVLVQLVVLAYCALDVLRTPREHVKFLPKPLWLVAIVLFPLIAGPAWLYAGRSKEPVGPARPQRAPLPPPDDDEEFLRELRRRADEQRRRAREDDEPPA